nr:Rho-type GTPase-activating 1 [Ipomoea batatas]
MAMRGVGGPLLCIGDLLSDVGEEGSASDNHSSRGADLKSSHFPESAPTLKPSDLPKLFQENYEKLNDALAGTDHSWTEHTLELCYALETTNKLVHSTNCNVGMLSDNVQKLQQMINRRDSDIAAAKAIQSSLEGMGTTGAEKHFQN